MSELQQPDATQPGDAPRVPADPPWGIGQALTILLAYVAVQIGLAVVIGVGSEPDLVRELVVLIASGLVILTIVASFLQARCDHGTRARRLIGLVLPGRAALARAAIPVLLGALAYAGVAIGWGVVLEALRRRGVEVPPQRMVELIEQTTSAWAIVFTFIAATVLVPAVEEVLFRAVLYLPMRRALGVRWAAVVVSAVFALVHVYPWGLPQLFVLSLIFVALFERTGTLLAPILAHAAYNAVQLVLVLMGSAGAPPAGP